MISGNRRHRLAPALALTLLGAAAPAAVSRNHFDSDAPMRPPAFFDFLVLGAPGAAEWMVLGDRNPPSSPNQVTQTRAGRPEGSVAAAMRRNVSFADGRISVAIKKGSSAAGLVFRFVGERDYLVLLVDQDAGEVRLAAVRSGISTEIARGRIEADREWGILSVELAGKKISSSWNARSVLTGSDDRPTAGLAGMATLNRASFDELVLEPAS